MVQVDIQPFALRTNVPLETFLTDTLEKAGIVLPQDCGGRGSCGSCFILVRGTVSEPNRAEKDMLDQDQLESGWRLACQAKAIGNIQIYVPRTTEILNTGWRIDESNQGQMHWDNPVIVGQSCEIPEPSLDDPRSDLERILNKVRHRAQKKGTFRHFADHYTVGHVSQLARRSGWRISVFTRGFEMVGAADWGQEPWGLAVDLGSTKLAAYLIDLHSGQILASEGLFNPQASFGADVVTRLQKAISDYEAGRRQTNLVREALDKLAGELARKAGGDSSRICELSLVGNSVMTHLLLGLPVEQLGLSPFVAAQNGAMEVKARDVGLNAAPGAYLYIPPLVGGFMGSDNTAMIMRAELDRPGPCRLGLDIGTNTEVVLSHPDGDHPIFIASAPSGPTFEGAPISSGMRAISGAIYRVELDDGEPVYYTIDQDTPAGICGSGIMDIIAELLREGIINRLGLMDRTNPHVDIHGNTLRYVLVPAAKTATGRDVAITQEDVSQIQLAKAAINAAVGTLLSMAGLQQSHIAEIILAGSFGSHFHMGNARRIGLLPDLSGAVFSQIGNAAGQGVQMVLNSHEARQRAEDIPAKCRYIELSRVRAFSTLYAQSLAFGNT